MNELYDLNNTINTIVICYAVNNICVLYSECERVVTSSMKRKAPTKEERRNRLGDLFLETQSVFKRAKFTHNDPILDQSMEMEIVFQHIEEVREMYAGYQQEFVQDLGYIQTEAQKAPNLFTTGQEFWDFLFVLIGRTRYPLLTYGQKVQCCLSCFENRECMKEPKLSVPLCSELCQSAFYKMFNMYNSQ
jgi:hypothetical protein